MTYRAWDLKTLDRAAVRELTHAIAEQRTEELEYSAMDEEPWSEQKYAATLAAQQKETALLAGILAARGITDPADALTLLAGEEELSDPALLTDMEKACQRIWQAIDNGETIVVFGDYDVDGVTATALLYQHLKGMGAAVKCMLPSREGDGQRHLRCSRGRLCRRAGHRPYHHRPPSAARDPAQGSGRGGPPPGGRYQPLQRAVRRRRSL